MTGHAKKRPSLKATFASARGMIGRLGPHLRGERKLLVLGTAALFGEVGTRLLEPWPLSVVVDGIIASTGSNVAGSAPQNVTTLIAGAALALLMITVLRAALSYTTTICFALAGNRVLTRVRGELFAHMQRLSMAFHDSTSTGDLVQRVTSDVGRLKEVAVTAMLPLLGNVVTLLGMVTVIAILDWELALIVIIVFPLFLIVGSRITTKIKVVSRRQRKSEGQLASIATEALSSMKVVQTYLLEDQMSGSFASSNTDSLHQGVQAKRLSAGLERFTDGLIGLATAVVLFAGAHRVLAGALTPGELTVFLTYLKSAFRPLRDIAKYTGRIAQAGASSERIFEILEREPAVADSPWVRPLIARHGYIEFDNVWLSYVPGHPILRGLDLAIRAGERVAIIGPSGTGKSSLVTLLSRLRDPDSGSVRVDGHDIRTVAVHSLRAQVSIVLQESVLFQGTVRANIAHGVPNATWADIEQAARLAGAHDFILSLPAGYDTVVSERGSTLSGGQRQRIAIARAAIRQAPIIVLDEAMTGLDEDTEREVVDALDRLTRGKTTLIITHDLDATRNCDRIIRLDSGRVAADSRPYGAFWDPDPTIPTRKKF